jgi:hypothetical protein
VEPIDEAKPKSPANRVALTLSSGAFSQKNPQPDGTWCMILYDLSRILIFLKRNFGQKLRVTKYSCRSSPFLTTRPSLAVLVSVKGITQCSSLLLPYYFCRFNQLGEDKRLWTIHNRKRWKKSKEGRAAVLEVFCVNLPICSLLTRFQSLFQGKPLYKLQMARFKENLLRIRQSQRDAEARLARERQGTDTTTKSCI